MPHLVQSCSVVDNKIEMRSSMSKKLSGGTLTLLKGLPELCSLRLLRMTTEPRPGTDSRQGHCFPAGAEDSQIDQKVEQLKNKQSVFLALVESKSAACGEGKEAFAQQGHPKS